MSARSLVWFITGTSQGFGKYLTEIALESPNCKALQLDVTDGFDAIQAKVQEGINAWGHVDVVVNNAGIGSPGITEEAGATGFAKAFNINFFGAMNVTVAFLPHLRARKSGTVVLIGSRHAWKSQHPFIGSYSASKAALHAWGESLSAEIKPFGIRVLIAQPGATRTNIITTAQANPLGGHAIEAYDALRTAGAQRYKNQAGKQPNDPVKAMTAIVDVVRGEGPAAGKPMPLWLVLGKDAEEDLREHVRQRLENLEEWKDVTRSVGVDSDDTVFI